MRQPLEGVPAARATHNGVPPISSNGDRPPAVIQLPQRLPEARGAAGDDAADRPPATDATPSIARRDTHVVLTASWFRFIVHWNLRQAQRHSNYLSLVTIRASREYIGLTVDVASQSLTELADVVGPLIRETDLLGEL